MEIKEAVILTAKQKRKFKVSDVLELLDNKYSRQAVSAAVNGLVKKGKLSRSGQTRGAFYFFPENIYSLEDSKTKRFLIKGLSEGDVLEKFRKEVSFINGLKDNVLNIFEYAFTEMVNNAIDHSGSKNVEIKVKKEHGNLIFIVNDFGKGVFRTVMKKMKQSTEMEAIQDILKGKTTTKPKEHSGEGIFFTSKASDVFILESFRNRLEINNIKDDVFVEEMKPIKRGTRVTFVLSLNSKKKLINIFKKYQVDPERYDFDKTEIRVVLYTLGTKYISRSHAKRLLSGLEKFQVIVLDFKNIRTVGQGFVDEVFRIFKLKYPDIVIKAINMKDPVSFMVKRAKKND